MEYLKKLLGQKDPNAAQEFFANDPTMMQDMEEGVDGYEQRPTEQASSELFERNVDRAINNPYTGEDVSSEVEAEATRRSKEMADQADAERLAFESQQSQPEKSLAAEPPKSRDQMILEELQKIRKGSDDELKSAKTMDAIGNLLNVVSPMIENRQRARAIRSAQSLGADPGSLNMPKFAADNASKALSERQSKLNELIQEQKLMAALRPKSMSKLDEAKIRESEAKAKMYEARSGQSELIKEETKIRSENRKEKKQLERDVQNTEKLVKDLEDTQKIFNKYSKDSIGGTGSIATGFGAKKLISADLERLDSKFKQQNLETMSKMFQGMSKAVDSDSERKAFEAAQPSITNDDSTNKQIIEERIKKAQDLLNKQRAKANSIDSKGNIIEPDQGAQKDSSIEQYAKQYNINYEAAQRILKSRGYNAK